MKSIKVDCNSSEIIEKPPHDFIGSVGTFWDGKILICGGKTQNTTSKCFTYDNEVCLLKYTVKSHK